MRIKCKLAGQPHGQGIYKRSQHAFTPPSTPYSSRLQMKSSTYDPTEKAPVSRQQQCPLPGDSSQGYPASESWNDASSVAPPAYETVNDSSGTNPLQRLPPASLTYPHFQPATLVSVSENLQNGFPLTVPPSATIPHPFALHDVHEQDWKAFLLDVQAAAPSTSNCKSRCPGMMLMMIPAAAIGTAGARRRCNKAKEADGLNHVHGTVDSWNKYFFHPRRMHVSLTQNRGGGSGPDISSDHESSSDKPDAGASNSLLSKRKERRESGSTRRTERPQEIQEKRASRRSQGGKWRIVVMYRTAMCD
ncbi:uncharacterized protein LAESUDRAFT_715376 [Laetiporus sulphureus 93-53]|uniref:Uncharacterized protein n=1 Tax=Laetiporus sulphureus 93-53 TaxID=1314785 RepID=A0A165DGN6_9APHY|nr:uncharacterized protein LAESUDRAFT_715376 [Laetiporus sulphureus 93-53]KZT04843.1 hypothetical protein LAESUDRAFT_715376 [Laetiporus sulphureus 93-53]